EGGSLSQQETQELQDERDIVQQVEQETKASSGRKPREETHARRCSKCGGTGHNARTCQIVIDMSEEEDSDDLECSVQRPRKELKAFTKVYLEKGEKRTVQLKLDKYAVSFWSEELEEWKVEAGDFEVIIGKSSDPKDELLKARFNVPKTFSWTGLREVIQYTHTDIKDRDLFLNHLARMMTLKKWLRDKLPWPLPTPDHPPLLPMKRPGILTPSPSTEALSLSTERYGYFQLLPYEIRRQILTEALGGRTLHVDLTYLNRPAHGQNYKEYSSADGKRRTEHSIGAMGWLLACREAYADGIDILFSTNTFHMDNFDLLQHLPRLILPQRLRSIKSLEISWTFRPTVTDEKPMEVLWNDPTTEDSVLHEMCRMIPELFPHVSQLDINFLYELRVRQEFQDAISALGGIERVILGPIEDMIRVLGPGREVCIAIQQSVFSDLHEKKQELYGSELKTEIYNPYITRFWKELDPDNGLGYWICRGAPDHGHFGNIYFNNF
ncbi:hypothetical protein V491_03102, partial [Pseudogymnoascus sp. VKM F-3775]